MGEGILSTTLRAKRSIGKLPTLFSAKNGAVLGVNRARLYETPFFLQTNPPNNSITVPAGQTSQTAPMRVSAEGPIQINRFGAFSSGPVSVMMWIKDGQRNTQLMNVPIHINTLFGIGGEMYPLPEGLSLDANAAIAIAYTDVAAAPTQETVQVAFASAKYSRLQPDPDLERARRAMAGKAYIAMPYWYGFDSQNVVLAGGANQQVEITIAQDHHFEVQSLSVFSTGQFALDLIDEAKGESIINAPSNSHYLVPNLLFTGSNQHPFVFRERRIIFAGQRLVAQLQDTSGVQNTIWFAVGGVSLAARMWL